MTPTPCLSDRINAYDLSTCMARIRQDYPNAVAAYIPIRGWLILPQIAADLDTAINYGNSSADAAWRFAFHLRYEWAL